MSKQELGTAPSIIILIITGIVSIPLGLIIGNYSPFPTLFVAIPVFILWVVYATIQIRKIARRMKTRDLAAAEQYRDRANVPIGVTSDGSAVYAADLAPGTHISGLATPDKTNTMAILALVFSIAGGVIAIPLGHIARSQIRRTRERGAGIALAGLIIGYVWVAAVVAYVIFIAIAVASLR